MIIYQEFLALNEELPAFDPSERLRFAVHEIMFKLKDGATVKFTELSKRLKDDFKINISEDLLKGIFSNWDKYQNPDYSFFKKEDKNWMDVWPFQGYIKRKCRDKQSFGKHRKKETTTYSNTSNINTNINTANTQRNPGTGYYSGGVWIPYASSVNRNKYIDPDDMYGHYYGD